MHSSAAPRLFEVVADKAALVTAPKGIKPGHRKKITSILQTVTLTSGDGDNFVDWEILPGDQMPRVTKAQFNAIQLLVDGDSAEAFDGMTYEVFDFDTGDFEKHEWTSVGGWASAPLQGADGADGAPGTPGAGVTWLGAWDSGTAYVENDAVEHNGSSWIANASSTNQEPGVEIEWDLWVQGAGFTPNQPEYYEADAGDGVTDATAAVQSALDHVADTGLPVIGDPSGTYAITSQLNWDSATGATLRMRNVNLQPSGAITALNVDTTDTAVVTTLSADTRTGRTDIDVTDATGMEVGDIIRLESDQQWPYSASYNKGEISTILSISGNTITLSNPVHFHYDIPGETVTVTARTPVSVDFENVNIDFVTVPSVAGTNAFSLDYCVNSSLRNCRVNAADQTGIGVNFGYQVVIDGCFATNCGTAGTALGYGVLFQRSTLCHVKNLTATNNRKAVDFGGSYPTNSCSVRDSNIIGRRDTGMCLDTHESANMITFEGNTLTSGTNGVGGRGQNLFVLNNTFISSGNACVALSGPTNAVISGNVHRPGDIDYLFPYDSSDTSFITIDNNSLAMATLWRDQQSMLVVEGNRCQPKANFINFSSNITEAHRVKISGNNVTFNYLNASQEQRFVNCGVACTFTDSLISDDNEVHVQVDQDPTKYTLLENATGIRFTATPELFGAKDGEDATNAIQAAIDAVGDSGTVQLSKGNYLVSSTLLINRGITLAGVGRGNENGAGYGSVLSWGGSGTDVVLQIGDGTLPAANPTHGWTLRNLTINGNSIAGTTGIQIGTGSEANNKSQSGTLENLYISNCASDGIRCYNAQLCVWSQVHVNNCGRGVVFAYFPGSGNTSQSIDGLRVTRCNSTGGGLVIQHLTSSTFHNCYTELNDYAGVVLDAIDPGSRINVKFDHFGSEANNQATRKSENMTFANGTETWTGTAHGYVDDDRVYLESTGTLPTGYDSATKYFVVNSTANTLQLSLTSGGAAVDGTTDGTGTISVIANGTGAAQVQAFATAPVSPLTDRNRPKVTFVNPRIGNTAIGNYEFDLSGFSATIVDPECEEGSIVTQSSVQETRAYVTTKYDPTGVDQPWRFAKTMVLTDASAEFTVGETITDDDDSGITGVIISQSGTAPNITIVYEPTGGEFKGGVPPTATEGFTGDESGSTGTAVDQATPASNFAECNFVDHDDSMAAKRYVSTSATNGWYLQSSLKGGDLALSSSDADSTIKRMRVTGRHWDIAESNVLMVQAATFTNDSIVDIGGGSSLYNAADRVSVWAAADTTTTTGTEMHRTTTVGLDLLTHDIVNAGDVLGSGVFGSSATEAIQIPSGITGERPGSPADGHLRINTTDGTTEIYRDSAWRDLEGAGGSGTPGGSVTSLQYNDGGGNFGGMAGVGWDDASHELTFLQQTASSTSLTLQGAASQTGNPFEVKNSAGTVQLSVGPSGDILTLGSVTVPGVVGASATEAIQIPVGTDAQRPGTPVDGDLRVNTDQATTEVYRDSAWRDLEAGGVGGADFANDDLTFDASHTHDLDGFDVEIIGSNLIQYLSLDEASDESRLGAAGSLFRVNSLGLDLVLGTGNDLRIDGDPGTSGQVPISGGSGVQATWGDLDADNLTGVTGTADDSTVLRGDSEWALKSSQKANSQTSGTDVDIDYTGGIVFHEVTLTANIDLNLVFGTSGVPASGQVIIGYLKVNLDGNTVSEGTGWDNFPPCEDGETYMLVIEAP